MITRRKVQGHKASVVIDDASDSCSEGAAVEDEVKAFISSMSKRLNRSSEKGVEKTPKGKKVKKVYEQRECIAKGCKAQTTFPLCGLCFHSLVSGKTSTVELDNGWGNAVFSTTTNRVTHPPGVPSDIIPKPKSSQ
jgi:hypothetical protein